MAALVNMQHTTNERLALLMQLRLETDAHVDAAFCSWHCQMTNY